MLVLGIILILLAAGMVYVAFAGATGQTAVFDVGAFNLEMNTLGVFVAGGATVLVLVLGLALLRAGLRSANRRRKEKKELKRLHARDERTTRPATGTGAAVGTASTGTSTSETSAPGATTPSGTTAGGTTPAGTSSGTASGGAHSTHGAPAGETAADHPTGSPDTQHGSGDHTHRDGPVTDR